MKVLLDTNVIMDALQERQPFDVEAKELLWRGQDRKIKCLFTSNAATDIFYLYSKARSVKTAKNVLHFLLTNYEIVSITQEDCRNALALPIDDFEDALVMVCGQKEAVDYIVTRDDKFLHDTSPVKTINPKGLLDKLE